MGVEGLDLPGAIERLAELSGIPAPRRRTADPQVQDATARLYAASAAASAWFARQLEQARGVEAPSRRAFRAQGVQGLQHHRLQVRVESGGGPSVTEDHIHGKGFPLGRWVAEMRRRHAAGELDAEQTAQIEALPDWRWQA